MNLFFRNSPSAALRGRGDFSGGIILIIPVAALSLFFIIPVLSIFRHLSPADFLENLQNPYYRSIISFTFLQAAVSTLSAVLLALPGAWIMSHLRFRGKRLVNSITTVPFVLPSVLVVLGFVLTFGNSGIINSLIMAITGAEKPPLKILYSFKAIILAHTFYNFPIPLRLIASAWKQTGRNRVEAAETLGAGRFRIFLTITLPALLPSLIASASLVFIFCFMSFAVILVLGGGPEFSTLEVEIYRLARIDLDINSAASLALLGAVLTGFFTWGYIRLQKTASRHTSAETPFPQAAFGRLRLPAKIFLMLYLAVILTLISGPLLAVIVRSFQHKSGWNIGVEYSLKNYFDIFHSTDTLKSISNTILIASASTLIALPTGFAAAWVIVRKKLRFPNATETLFMLPMGVSAVVIGLGYYSLLALLPESFDGGILLIVFAHAVISLPFVVRTFSTGLRSLRESLLEASAILGAGGLSTLLRVELPLLRSSIISASAFAFCISAGEINASLILAGGGTSTIPITIYRMISSYRFYGACALGAVLMAICGIAFYLIDRYGGDDLF